MQRPCLCRGFCKVQGEEAEAEEDDTGRGQRSDFKGTRLGKSKLVEDSKKKDGNFEGHFVTESLSKLRVLVGVDRGPCQQPIEATPKVNFSGFRKLLLGQGSEQSTRVDESCSTEFRVIE